MDDLFLDNLNCEKEQEAPEKRDAESAMASAAAADASEAPEACGDSGTAGNAGAGQEICENTGAGGLIPAETAEITAEPAADAAAEATVPATARQTEVRDGRPSIFAANALYLLAGAGLVLMQVLSGPLATLLTRLFPSMSMETLLLAVNSLYYFPFLLLPAAIYAGRHDAWAGMRLSRAPKWKHVWRALLATVVAIPLGSALAALWYMVLQACGLTIVEQDFPVPSTASGLLLMTLCLGVLPGVCEELAFRGMALGAWERRGSVRAILISSLMFASLHGSIAGFPVHFLLGCMIGVMTVGSGSIYTGMIFHGVYNSLLLVMQYFVQNAMTVAEEDLATAELLMDDAMAVVGVIGAVMLIIVVILMGAAMFFILRGLWPQKADTDYGSDDWERPEEREPVKNDVELVPRTRGRMDWQEVLVLISAVVTVLFMYGQDLLTMIGGGA